MRIALTTVGSTGDIQPFLALGKSLIRAGHDVRALSHPFHAHRFAEAGIPFVPCGPILSQQELNEFLDRMMSQRDPLKQLEVLMREAFFVDGVEYFNAAKAALTDRELVVSHMIDFLGQEAAAQLGIPRIGVILTHAIVPTRVSTPALVPNLGPFNPLVWRMLTWMLRKVDAEAMEFLKKVGGPSIKIQHYTALSPELNLLAASETLAGVPSRALPAHVKCTGPWLLDSPGYQPDPDLEAFLRKYPKPVIVSFGSMGGSQGPRLTAVVLEALKRLGLPAVVQGGYAGLHDDSAPENVHFAGFVPHEYLFAQGSCVVHHGGAGTTNAACRAGVPSVVVAFIADQPYFAERLRKHGLAPKFIWHYRLNAKRLAKRIDQALAGGRMGARARAMQAQFCAEDGVEQAVAWIERFGNEHKGLKR